MDARRAGGPTAIVAGAIGGLVGTVAMGLCQAGWTSLTHPRHAPRRLKHAGIGLRRPSQSEPRSHENPLSTSEQLIDATSKRLLNRTPTQRQRELLGSISHYGFGMTAGAIYGVLARHNPTLTRGHGTLYGLLVWLVADEMLVPAMRIADPPWRSPLRLHLYAIAAHLAYGSALETTRRGLMHRSAQK